jgi:hypothetical protein
LRSQGVFEVALQIRFTQRPFLICITKAGICQRLI